MKIILVSLPPEQVARILNGDQTIIIQKIAPKCELPIEVYIYCTKKDKGLRYWGYHMGGRIFAKFTLRKVEELVLDHFGYYAVKASDRLLIDQECWIHKTCTTNVDLVEYLKGKVGYAWHISDLQIFDEPKELSEFKQSKLPNPKKIKFANWTAHYYWFLGNYTTTHGQMTCGEIIKAVDDLISVKRAPQSWCYVSDGKLDKVWL